MDDNQSRTVVVFGGTGFLGRRVVCHLLDKGFRVRAASRHPERETAKPRLESIVADVGKPETVRHALSGAWGCVNAVSLYVEKNGKTFDSTHVQAAGGVAAAAHESGVERFLHVSGIGSDPHSRSKYVRSRGKGEIVVRNEFPGAVLVRPAVMFGTDDAFLVPLTKLLCRFPVFAMFGRGDTKLQPAYVEDVAEGMSRVFELSKPAPLYEFGGPQIYHYRDLLHMICQRCDARPILVPLPFGIWHVLAGAAEWFTRPALTRNQVELMTIDNISSPARPGFAALNIEPTSPEAIIDQIASRQPKESKQGRT
jgi:NADH dehydrogenase